MVRFARVRETVAVTFRLSPPLSARGYFVCPASLSRISDGSSRKRVPSMIALNFKGSIGSNQHANANQYQPPKKSHRNRLLAILFACKKFIVLPRKLLCKGDRDYSDEATNQVHPSSRKRQVVQALPPQRQFASPK